MLVAGLPPSAFAVRAPKRSGRLFEVKQPLLIIMRERYSRRKGKKVPGMMIRDVEIALKALESRITESDTKKRILKPWKETCTLTPEDTLEGPFLKGPRPKRSICNLITWPSIEDALYYFAGSETVLFEISLPSSGALLRWSTRISEQWRQSCLM